MKQPGSFLPLAFGNVAHSYSHLFMLMYATVVLALEAEWGLSYAELIAVSIPAGGKHHLLLLFVAITVTPGTAVVAAVKAL